MEKARTYQRELIEGNGTCVLINYKGNDFLYNIFMEMMNNNGITIMFYLKIRGMFVFNYIAVKLKYYFIIKFFFYFVRYSVYSKFVPFCIFVYYVKHIIQFYFSYSLSL